MNLFFWKNKKKKHNKEIEPDEIFLDSSNLPHFDVNQFEGRLEKPISLRSFYFLCGVFILILFVVFSKVWILQVRDGEMYVKKSENNRLKNSLIFSERGVINDRNNVPLVWNTVNPEDENYSLRKYIDLNGFANLLGYVKYPTKDNAGIYWNESYDGKDGVEKFYNSSLTGKNGVQVIETDALGNIQSSYKIEPPQEGQTLTLTIDSNVQNKLYEIISETARKVSFQGGAGIIMNIKTGEVLAITTFPEYNSNVLSDGSDSKEINAYLKNKNNPFLNRVSSGLYTPGSIVKPYVALGALKEGIITPEKKILSTGSISIPNLYDKSKPSVFRDWKAHGWVDMRQAIAVSSDVYFYEIGGGFQDQKGLGIYNIDKYIRMFGMGEEVKGFFNGPKGTIPTPEWKLENFQNEPWRVGDTYLTAIGQYGFQVTPAQMVRAVAAIANGGKLLDPILTKQEYFILNEKTVDIPLSDFEVVREGMRKGVMPGGTAQALNVPGVNVAAKTGTAELGAKKDFVNSWVTGFFPYEKPEWAFAIVMERGPKTNLIGAPYVMNQMLTWMVKNAKEYTKSD
ncbi:MAG: penicillin-binding transpeptidase domain-containing protein [Candidatus Paceibacterota bacterium]